MRGRPFFVVFIDSLCGMDDVWTMRERTWKSRLVSIACWGSTAVCSGLCCCWVVGAWWYWFDLVAGFAAQCVGLAFFVGCMLLALKRWRAGMVCLLAVCIGAWPLVVGREIWIAPAPTLQTHSVSGGGLMRVVSQNMNPENPRWRENLAELVALEPDVMMLIEVPLEFNLEIRREGFVAGGVDWFFEYRAGRPDGESSCYVLSRTPLERVGLMESGGSGGSGTQDTLVCLTTCRGIDLVVVAAHPMSPRDPNRWEGGLDRLRILVHQLKRYHGDRAMLIGTDLNGGPASLRARMLREYWFSASKPILGGRGTFPSKAWAWMKIQIDDVWHSTGVNVSGWSRVELGGSDHDGVVIDFTVDQARVERGP